MDINDSTKYLSTLIDAGADAMTNLYYVKFSGGLVTDTISTALTIRNSDIKLPTFTQDTVSKSFMTTSIDIPKASFSGAKEFSVTFRVDDNYSIYSYLLSQMSVTSVANLGFASNDVPDSTSTGFDVSVCAAAQSILDPSQVAPETTGITDGFQLLYQFHHCWIKNLTPLSYQYASSTPLTVTATIAFFDFEDPQNLL